MPPELVLVEVNVPVDPKPEPVLFDPDELVSPAPPAPTVSTISTRAPQLAASTTVVATIPQKASLCMHL
jgi:hypothetical protein